MAQASAAARLLRQRPCDPTAAGMLSSRVLYRFLSSTSSSPMFRAPHRSKQPAASVASTACKSSSSSWSLCAWFGSHPRRQLNAASAATTRTLHHALSSAATVSSEATTPASQSQLLGFIKSTFGTLEGQNHCWLNAANGMEDL